MGIFNAEEIIIEFTNWKDSNFDLDKTGRYRSDGGGAKRYRPKIGGNYYDVTKMVKLEPQNVFSIEQIYKMWQDE